MRDHAAFHADLETGKYRTVTDAVIAAGLKKPRTRLPELKNAWGKATRSDQHAFLKCIRAGVPRAVPSISMSSLPTPIAVNQRLIPAASARIEEIIAKRHLRPGVQMLGARYWMPQVGTNIADGM